MSGGDAARQPVVDPGVGALETRLEGDAWLPAQAALDEGVVAVPPPHPGRRGELVAAAELHAGDLFDQVDEAVDGDEFARPEVDRLLDVAVHDLPRAHDAVVDVHERTGLLPV